MKNRRSKNIKHVNVRLALSGNWEKKKKNNHRLLNNQPTDSVRMLGYLVRQHSGLLRTWSERGAGLKYLITVRNVCSWVFSMIHTHTHSAADYIRVTQNVLRINCAIIMFIKDQRRNRYDSTIGHFSSPKVRCMHQFSLFKHILLTTSCYGEKHN